MNSKSRGYIGPIADDIPSLVAILLALSMFFSSLTFTLTNYNEKLQKFNEIKGTMDIIKEINSGGIITSTTQASDLVSKVKQVAQSYGLSYCVTINRPSSPDTSCSPTTVTGCGENWATYRYLLAEYDASTGNISLVPVSVCGG